MIKHNLNSFIDSYYDSLDLDVINDYLSSRDYLKYCSTATYPPLKALNISDNEKTEKNFHNSSSHPFAIYIHFPYCHQLCSFCHFNVNISKNLNLYEGYIDLLCKEIELKKESLSNRKITRIFFGGGTPSLLTIEQIEKVISKIFQYGLRSTSTKIHFEIHPGSKNIDNSYLKNLKEIGFNRLNIGVQDLNESILKKINRGHTASDVKRIISTVHNHSFDFNIDVMSPLPGQNLTNFIFSFEEIINLKPTEITLNITSIRNKMKIAKDFNNKLLPDISENLKINIAAQVLSSLNGMYENIPRNFSKRRHRVFNYFDEDLIAFGAGAYSNFSDAFIYNHLDIKKYSKAILANQLPTYKSILLSQNEINHKKMVFFARKGKIEDLLISKTGEKLFDKFELEINKLIELKLVERSANLITLTSVGKLFRDEIGKLFTSTEVIKQLKNISSEKDNFLNHFYEI